MEVLVSIISIISGVVSLYFLVYKPMNQNAINVKENAMNTKANTKALDDFRSEVKEELKEIRRSQKEGIESLEKKKHESHEKIWKHNEEQDKLLEEHTLKIKVIEREIGIDGKRD